MTIFSQRRSIRKYDENEKINDKTLKEIIELAKLAPSSMNLQPTRLLVIKSEENKAKLKNIFYGNLSQLNTSSHIIVLFTNLKKFDDAPKIFSEAYNNKIIPKNIMDDQIKKISDTKNLISQEKIIEDGFLDAGMFAMQFMLVLKKFGYDSCPIGGFNKKIINDVFNIDKNLYPVLIISIGKKAEEGFPSYRLSFDDITKII